MNVARGTGRTVARLLALALLVLAGLGGWPRREPTTRGCRAGAHVCCCAPAGQGACACAGHQGPAAQLVSLVSCGDPADAPAQNLTGTPGLPPAQCSLLAALCPVATPARPAPPAVDAFAREPSPPPPRSRFLSRRV